MTEPKLNLIRGYKRKEIIIPKEYKNEYKRMFPSKMSSTNFLSMYTLYYIYKAGQPVYGKEILNEIENTFDSNVWKPSHGTLYPLLRKLVKEKLLEVYTETKLKKYYIITELGKETIKNEIPELREIILSSSKFFNKVYKDLK